MNSVAFGAGLLACLWVEGAWPVDGVGIGVRDLSILEFGRSGADMPEGLRDIAGGSPGWLYWLGLYEF